jgi:FMN-dependent NADH-azoreductase
VVLISSPMWNFHVPYALKYHIDTIVQPGYLFTYESGIPVGLCGGKKIVCVTSRGGDYSTGPMHSYDFQEPYLRAISDLSASPTWNSSMCSPPTCADRRAASVRAGMESARRLAAEVAGTTVLTA